MRRRLVLAVAALAAVGLFSPTLAFGQTCSGPSLGAAANYNVFAFEHVTSGADVTGKVAAGTTASLLGFSVAGANPGGAALVAGQMLSLSNGTVFGNAYYGGSASVANNVTFSGGTLVQGSPINFGAAESNLEALAATLAAYPSTGTTTVHSWGGVSFSGSNSGLNVFSVAGSAFTNANNVAVNVPSGATVLINVTGSSASPSYFGFSYSGASNNRVLYNFHQAQNLSITGIGWRGTLLAPHADVSFNNGSLDGQIVVESLVGSGEPHHVPFRTDTCSLATPRSAKQRAGRAVVSDAHNSAH